MSFFNGGNWCIKRIEMVSPASDAILIGVWVCVSCLGLDGYDIHNYHKHPSLWGLNIYHCGDLTSLWLNAVYNSHGLSLNNEFPFRIVKTKLSPQLKSHLPRLLHCAGCTLLYSLSTTCTRILLSLFASALRTSISIKHTFTHRHLMSNASCRKTLVQLTFNWPWDLLVLIYGHGNVTMEQLWNV